MLDGSNLYKLYYTLLLIHTIITSQPQHIITNSAGQTTLSSAAWEQAFVLRGGLLHIIQLVTRHSLELGGAYAVDVPTINSVQNQSLSCIRLLLATLDKMRATANDLLSMSLTPQQDEQPPVESQPPLQSAIADDQAQKMDEQESGDGAESRKA